MSNTVDFFVAGGTLRSDADSYVLRAADRELFERAKAGEFCYILTPRQMGKSSLMIRTAQRLEQAGQRIAVIDLTGTGTKAAEIDAWYQGLLMRLKAELGLRADIQAWWATHQGLGAAQRFTEFLRTVVLSEVSQPVTIFIDEIDSTLGLDFSDDFFAAIRFIYNERANDPIYQRLTFVLLGVATPSDLIKDQSRTPFNIGHRIELQEFGREEAQVLTAGLEQYYPGQGEFILNRALYWTHGHPYLTQKLCLAAVDASVTEWTKSQVDQLVEISFFSDEARNDTNLKFVQSMIQARTDSEQRELLKLYQQVYRGKNIDRNERSSTQNYLMLFGLVREAQNRLQVRNEIYRHVFDQAWIKENMPVNTQQRVAVITGLITAMLVLLAGFIIYTSQAPPEIQAELCRNNFNEASSPTVRLDALACLFDLGSGYDEQARRLFYGLSPTEQQYLFFLDDPASVGSQLISVVKGIYVSLDEMEGDHDHALMEAMVQALEDSNQSGAGALVEEINAWMAGREHAASQQYDQAITAYSTAIALNINRNHPVIFYDRALVYIELGQYEDALADLERIVIIAYSAPPTPTPTPIQLPTTPIPTATSIPTHTPTPGATSLIQVTLTLTQPQVSQLTLTPQSSTFPIVSQTPTPEEVLSNITINLRFLNSNQIIVTVGETILQNVNLQDQLIQNRIKYPQLDRTFATEVEAAIDSRKTPTPATTPQLPTFPTATLTPVSSFTIPPSSSPVPLSFSTQTPITKTIRVVFDDGTVKIMTVEEYLRAVVPAEMPALWHTEAVKAMAVVARTFAYYSIQYPRHPPQADMCTTTHCQLFDPSKIHPATDAAIRETKDVVILYNTELIAAIHHNSSGGHTLNNEDVFSGGTPVPYLRGVPSPYLGEKFGHGVGFEVQGARLFAEQGYSYDQIIKYFYSGVTLGTLPSLPLPDLITSLETTGPPVFGSDAIEVPVSVTVINQRDIPAGIFKVSVEYIGPNGTFVAPFTVPEQSDSWYPYTITPLIGGNAITFIGKVTLPISLRGQTVSIRATVDSCSGDEFMPTYCRIEEFDENNNGSTPLVIPLAPVESPFTLPGPTPTIKPSKP